MVETVRGGVATADLGATLMHEHVFVLDLELLHNYPEEWGDEDKRIADAASRLNELKATGVDSIVDLTVMGLGRSIQRIKKVAALTPINIIVATGFYTYNELPHYFHFRGPGMIAGGPEPLTEMFIRDITRGIADTGVKAGMLKCATDQPGVTKDVDRILRAVAQAHRTTGTPISTHTNARRRNGLDQQRIFREEGVDLSRVVIGHCGDTNEIDYLEELMGNGSLIGMDRFGIDSILSFEERVGTVAALCERGHAGQIVLSHDASCFLHWMPESLIPLALPRWNYLHIHREVLPALRERGVSDEQIRTMMVDNPRRIFESRGSY
jgi:phosphotriesterase-related protein